MLEGLILIGIGLFILLCILCWILGEAILKHYFRLFWRAKYEVEEEMRRR